MFSDILKNLRKSNGVKQEELGKICGVAPNTISSWENGITQPPLETIKVIAEYFKVSTDYLLGYNQEDMERIKRLKMALKEAGLFNGDDDMTLEDLESAMKIVAVLKERKEKKN